ncbi:MAG: DNA polymerase III subunit delta [Bacteroidia bacterium]
MFFRDIIGQLEIKQRLTASVASNRISHAQLVFGPEGCGALPIAVAYAQYVHCTNRGAEDSCGECPSCIKYNKLVHPDLHFAFPIKSMKDTPVSDSFIAEWRDTFLDNPYFSIDEWTEKIEAENKQLIIPEKESVEILRKLNLTTFEAEYKIMIIWMPEKMNLTSANKLLKILEEPPEKTLFLLVTESEDQLLRTIVSRTQLVRMRKIADAELRDAMMKRHELTQADAEKIAFLADGNYAFARSLLERTEQAAYNLATFQKLMRSTLKFDPAKVLAVVDDLAGIGRERQKQFFSYSLDLIRECFLLSYADQSLVRMAGEELEFISKFSKFIHSANGEKMIEEFNLAMKHIERNGAPKIILLDLAFRLNELINIPRPVLS